MSLPLPDGDPCYFCEIVSGQADPWNVVKRSETTLVVLNGRQYEIGQCMVVPARHAATLLDLTEAELTQIMIEAQRLAGLMVRLYKPDGVLIYQNNGVGSGQEVPHFHLHVIPRRHGSDWGLGPPHLARFEAEGRPPQFNYALPTDGKRATVEELRTSMR